MNISRFTTALVVAAIVALPCSVRAADAAKSPSVSPPSSKQLAHGRYVLIQGSCNDCHTPEFGPRDGNVPEKDWLLGSGPLGFSGPWGTTYPPNLRLTVSKLTEAQWVKYAKGLKTRPPMPWFNLNQWSASDLRALYHYIKSLGPVGEPAQAYQPPDKAPKPPYIQWPAPPK